MTSPNDRQRQAEEMANKYCDENFATQHHDEYWENKSSYLKGWTDADSTPPQQEGDEEFYKRINYFVWNYCDRDQRMTAESAFVQVLSDALAHARRTHAAEIERLKDEQSKMLCAATGGKFSKLSNIESMLGAIRQEFEDIDDEYSEKINELRALLEEASGFIRALNIVPPTKECEQMTTKWLKDLEEL